VRILDLGKHRKARIWLGTLPHAVFSPSETIHYAIPARGQLREDPRLAAIEWLVPLGPRFMYGLLGGDFTSNLNDSFQVEVCTSVEDGPHFSNSLANQIDEARVGFPAEYAPAVSLGVDLAAKSELKGQGRKTSDKLLSSWTRRVKHRDK
jgi:hypothetical protein